MELHTIQNKGSHWKYIGKVTAVEEGTKNKQQQKMSLSQLTKLGQSLVGLVLS